MAAIFEQAAGTVKQTWECKQCHERVTEEHNVAYHLIDGFLYGWCENCFRNRPSVIRTAPGIAA